MSSLMIIGEDKTNNEKKTSNVQSTNPKGKRKEEFQETFHPVSDYNYHKRKKTDSRSALKFSDVLSLKIMKKSCKEKRVTTQSNRRMLQSCLENQQPKDLRRSLLPGLPLHPIVQQH